MKWPRSSSACGAGRWNLFLRSSFPPSPPPPPPSSHPGSGAARAEYASRSPHRPIQLFTARSPGNQLGRQQVRYFRLENCPFVRTNETNAASSVENLSATTTRGRLRYKSILLNLVDASHVILRKIQFLQKGLL